MDEKEFQQQIIKGMAKIAISMERTAEAVERLADAMEPLAALVKEEVEQSG